MEEFRCKGRSTRLADDYIQYLFKEGIVEVRDHHENGHKHLFYKIEDRLRREHSRVEFEFNIRSLVIKIKNFK